MTSVFNDLLNGYLDGALLLNIQARSYIDNRFSENLKMGNPLDDEGLRIVTLLKNKELIEIFNRALEKLKKEGKIESIKKKWEI